MRALLVAVLLTACTSETPEQRDRYGNCYHDEISEMGASNVCHQYCKKTGLHGYDVKDGQLLVCVCDDPKPDQETQE